MTRLRRGLICSLMSVLVLPASALAAGQAVSTTTYFAGYLLVSTKIQTSTATFVVPRITCTSGESGVGPSILLVSTVKNNTYTYSGGAVGVACAHNKPVYVSIIVVDGSSSNDLTLSAGDHVKVTVTMRRTGSKVTFNDLTSHRSKSRSGAGHVTGEAYVGDNGLQINSRNVRLDPFTTTTVTGATINGSSLATEHAQRTNWARGSTTLVTAGALKNGTNFKLAFQHS